MSPSRHLLTEPIGIGSATTASSLAAQQSEFAKRAAWIGQGIHTASQKLFKLSQLAKRTSMFDDPAQEISDLSSSIKLEIQNLNAGLADLQTLSQMSRESNVHSLNHSHTVIDNLRSRLKDTTKEFGNVLNLRKENLKVHQGRQQLYTASADRAGASPTPAVHAHTTPVEAVSGHTCPSVFASESCYAACFALSPSMMSICLFNALLSWFHDLQGPAAASRGRRMAS